MVWGLLHLHTNVYLCVFTFLRLWDAGNLSWLCECLENKVGINGLDKAGNTALYWGCHGGHKGHRSSTTHIPLLSLTVYRMYRHVPQQNHTLSFFSWMTGQMHVSPHTLQWDVWQCCVVIFVTDVVEILLGQSNVELNQQVRRTV